jgi:hypothetical protein
MSADSTCQDTDYARHIQEILDELGQLQQTPQLMTSPEDLEALEHEIRQRTGRVLAGCGYCFGSSPKRSERGQSAGHHHSKPVFKTLFTPLGMYLSAPNPSTPRSVTSILF